MVGFFGLILGIVLIMIVVEIQKRKKMSEDEKQVAIHTCILICIIFVASFPGLPQLFSIA